MVREGSGSPFIGPWTQETIFGVLLEGALQCGVNQGQELCAQLVGA